MYIVMRVEYAEVQLRTSRGICVVMFTDYFKNVAVRKRVSVKMKKRMLR